VALCAKSEHIFARLESFPSRHMSTLDIAVPAQIPRSALLPILPRAAAVKLILERILPSGDQGSFLGASQAQSYFSDFSAGLR
jgi:hypothetical protein